MTQIEAVEKALNILGGKAELKYIYMVAIDLIGEHQSNNIWANIRRCLNSNPKLFYPLKEKGEGWWGLVSYKDELNERDLKIMELQAEVKTLKSRPTVEDFVKKLVKVTKLLFKIHRNHADFIRQVLEFLGYTKDAEDLAAWIEHKENRLVDAVEKMAEKPAVLVDVKTGGIAQITDQGVTNQYPQLPNE